MKKATLLLALVLSLAMATVCFADGVEEADAAGAEVTETTEQECEVNSAVGMWQNMGTAGARISFPGAFWYVYPNGTVGDYNQEVSIPIQLKEDGSFTVDLTGIEELADYADYTITGEVMPVSEDDLSLYNVTRDKNYVSYDTKQLILTLSYPDPSNPLASSPAESTVLFLPYGGLSNTLENYMPGKVWNIGDNVLVIDSDKNLDLNNGASTGTIGFYGNSDSSIDTKIEFHWDNGGRIDYVPVVIATDRIELQNMDKPEEVLVLELNEDVREAVEEVVEDEVVEDAADEAEEVVDDPAGEVVETVSENPFVGEWELQMVAKNDEEIPAKELLQDDGMTAVVSEDGMLTLTFASGMKVDIEPTYEGDTLTAHYGEFDYDMDWVAVVPEDNVAIATYEDYSIVLTKVQ